MSWLGRSSWNFAMGSLEERIVAYANASTNLLTNELDKLRERVEKAEERSSCSFRTASLEERIAAYANASANLLTQFNELDKLRERLKKGQKLSTAMAKPMKQRLACFDRRAPTPRAHRR
jgi:predicted  nucleic acid-binding Zn-ribbon protein